MDGIKLTNDRAKSCSVTGILNKTGRGGTGEIGNDSPGSGEGNQPRIVRVSRTAIRSDGMIIQIIEHSTPLHYVRVLHARWVCEHLGFVHTVPTRKPRSLQHLH